MEKTPVAVQRVLDELLVGASLKSFEWDSFYSISFLLRSEQGIPAELLLTICNNWEFQGTEELVNHGEIKLTPLDPYDCVRGYVLAGVAKKEVESVGLYKGRINISFNGGVVMSIPLENSDDPDEDAFVLKTPEWINPDEKRYISVSGNGEISTY